jgi:hypothetical protein
MKPCFGAVFRRCEQHPTANNPPRLSFVPVLPSASEIRDLILKGKRPGRDEFVWMRDVSFWMIYAPPPLVNEAQ